MKDEAKYNADFQYARVAGPSETGNEIVENDNALRYVTPCLLFVGGGSQLDE